MIAEEFLLDLLIKAKAPVIVACDHDRFYHTLSCPSLAQHPPKRYFLTPAKARATGLMACPLCEHLVEPPPA